jgi:hypothetical protein
MKLCANRGRKSDNFGRRRKDALLCRICAQAPINHFNLFQGRPGNIWEGRLRKKRNRQAEQSFLGDVRVLCSGRICTGRCRRQR